MRYRVRRDLQYRALGGKLRRFPIGTECRSIAPEQLTPEQREGLADAKLVAVASGFGELVIAVDLEGLRFVRVGDHIEELPEEEQSKSERRRR